MLARFLYTLSWSPRMMFAGKIAPIAIGICKDNPDSKKIKQMLPLRWPQAVSGKPQVWERVNRCNCRNGPEACRLNLLFSSNNRKGIIQPNRLKLQ